MSDTPATLNDPAVMDDLLFQPHIWAVVGCSPSAASVAHSVALALRAHGQRIVPVNPSVDGEVFGEPIRSSLDELAGLDPPVDVIDIYRRADGVAALVDQAIPLRPKAIWLQLGAIDHDAARRAMDAGIHVVMDRCPKIEYAFR